MVRGRGGISQPSTEPTKLLTYLTNELVPALGSAAAVFSLASSLVCGTSRGRTNWELETPRRRGEEWVMRGGEVLISKYKTVKTVTYLNQPRAPLRDSPRLAAR